MANYLRRIEAVEKVIAPRATTCVHVIVLDKGQTQSEALAAYAESRGLATANIGPAVYLSYVDAKL